MKKYKLNPKIAQYEGSIIHRKNYKMWREPKLDLVQYSICWYACMHASIVLILSASIQNCKYPDLALERDSALRCACTMRLAVVQKTCLMQF